jgi:hypothetical protein
MKLRVSTGQMSLEIELADTPNARAVLEATPFESQAQTWGEEVYFSTPVSAKLEPGAQQVVAPGTVCFWTEGNALALPFGRTPLSTDARPRLANPCNVLGRIAGDPSILGKVRAGDPIRVERA